MELIRGFSVLSWLILLGGLIGILIFIQKRRPKGNYSRMKFFIDEYNELTVFAGEIDPIPYSRYTKIAGERANLKIKILVGPWILIKDSIFRDFFEDGKLKNHEDLWKIHPLFELCRKYPDRISVYFKPYTLDDESHFAIAGKKKLFVELPHGRRKFRGGYIYNQPDKITEKFKEFDKILSACVKLSAENIDKILNELPLLEFCPVGKRKSPWISFHRNSGE